MVAERTREYEMVMILSPEATREEVESTVERVDGLISGGGGAVAGHENWGLKQLAYEIDDFNEGNYVLTRFSLDAAGVAELNQALTASEDIVRFLVTRQEFPAPSEDAAEESDSQADAGPGPSSEAEAAPEAAASSEAVAVAEAEATPEAATSSEEAGGEQA